MTMELFYGWLRHKLALEFLESQLVTKLPRPVVSQILQLGLYQLHFMKVPAHAAVHETVALAKRHANKAEAGFINAVLRRSDSAALAKAPAWVRLSHPQWLYERHGTAWCEWNNQPPTVYARGTEPWPGVLEPSGLHPLSYRIADPGKFFAAPGKYYVQDPSTLVAVDLLDPQPGETVLDMCAAPGGKTTYIAHKMQNRGEIIAADASSSRLGMVGENCRRLGVNIVATIACESGRCLPARNFDRVLVDAPCSNTGVLRRRPDLRWRITPGEVERLAKVQRHLLAAAVQLAKSGGVVVYSTCSLEREENEDVIASLKLPGWKLEAIRKSVPPQDKMDGAFAARLRNG